MALASITAATKPVQSKGLFASMGGKTYDDWKAGSGDSPFPSIAPAQVDDTVTTPLNKLLKSDGPLMTVARTEGRLRPEVGVAGDPRDLRVGEDRSVEAGGLLGLVVERQKGVDVRHGGTVRVGGQGVKAMAARSPDPLE